MARFLFGFGKGSRAPHAAVFLLMGPLLLKCWAADED